MTAAPEHVYAALTTTEGLAAWWTVETTAPDDTTLRFRFGGVGGADMSVVELVTNKRVQW